MPATPFNAVADTYNGYLKNVIMCMCWIESDAGRSLQLQVGADDAHPRNALPHPVQPTHVRVESVRFPQIVDALKRRYSRPGMHVRPYNIEPLQYLDNHRARPPRGRLCVPYGKGCLRRAGERVKRRAAAIVLINKWKATVDGDRLPSLASTTWLPHGCPVHLSPAHPRPSAPCRAFACLPSSQTNRKSRDLLQRFVATASDALAAGCPVLAHRDLVRRSPASLRPLLVSLGSERPQDGARARALLHEAARGAAWRENLAKRHDSAMGACLGGDAQ